MARSRTGSIYKDKDGRIYARIQWRDDEGRPKEIKRRADSRTDARGIIKEEIARLDAGYGGHASRRTFREVAAEYERIELIEAVIVDGRKVAGKLDAYTPRKIVRTLVDHFGNRPIQAITRPDIEEFRRQRFATPKKYGGNRSIRSVNYDLQVLRAIFYFAESKRWLDRSPKDLFRKLILTSEETKRSRLLTPAEERKLITACSAPSRLHLRPLVVAALDTSLRKGALLGLTWQDIDFENRIIHVKRSEARNKAAAEIVGITTRLEAELREVWRFSDKQPETLVFGIEGDIKSAWTAALREAEITNLRFHDLRGCAATSMIMAGIPEEIVRKATGHARAGILRDHYIRTNKDSIRRIADALDAMRGSSDGEGYVN